MNNLSKYAGRGYGNRTEHWLDVQEVLRRIYQKFDRIIIGNFSLKLENVNYEDANAPAYTNRKMIGIATDVIAYQATRFSWRESMVTLIYKGYNMHEVAHNLYTPPDYFDPSSKLCEETKEHRYGWNLLEDMRIERLLVAQFPLMKAYLRAAVVHCVSMIQTNRIGAGIQYDSHPWPIIAGRSYLPLVDRDGWKEDWIDSSRSANVVHIYNGLPLSPEDAADKFVEIVDEAKACILPADHAKFMSLVIQAEQVLGFNPNNSTQPIDVYTASNQSADGSQQNQQIASVMAQQSDADTDSESGSAKTGALGTLLEEKQNGRMDQREAMAEELKEAEANREIKEDLQDAGEQIRDQIIDAKLSRKSKAPYSTPVNGEMKTTADQIARHVQRLQDDLEDGWVKRQAHGRLNTRTAMDSRGAHTEVFDQYRGSYEEYASVEGVVLYDGSGSMSGSIRNVAEGAWALKAGFDKRKVRTTVIHYSSTGDEAVVYRADDKVENNMAKYEYAGQNTAPSGAIELAQYALGMSKARHKYLVILTDGSWGDTIESEAKIAALRSKGVATGIIYYSSNVPAMTHSELHNYFGHGCEYFTHARQTRDIVRFVESIVIRFLRERH